MKQFIEKHGNSIAHTLSGFDRIRLGGAISLFSNGAGLRTFFEASPGAYCQARKFFQDTTQEIISSGQQIASAAGRPLVYVSKSTVSKQAKASRIAAEDGITQGLVCVLTSVDPCYTYRFQRDKDGNVEWLPEQRKCLHQYFYVQHPGLGLINVRIQTWCPFRVSVNINGREWLARQMDRRGIRYHKADNCFLWIDDPEAAQQLALQQRKWKFGWILNRLCRVFHPTWHSRLTFRGHPLEYFWTMRETEWATDLVFKSRAALDEIYGDLIRFALLRFDSTKVMRFLGRTTAIRSNSNYEVSSDCRRRPEGIRIRHWGGVNSVKMYNKQHCVLRVETTINDPKPFSTVRSRLDDPESPEIKRPVPKSVQGAKDRADVSQQVNERYLDALAGADVPQTTAGDLLSPLAQRISWEGRPIRGLRFFEKGDAELLTAIGNGKFAINGFRNRDIRQLLAGQGLSDDELKKLTNRVTRMLRMLRGHNIISKIAGTHRYQLTDVGQAVVSAVTVTKKASLAELLAVAA